MSPLGNREHKPGTPIPGSQSKERTVPQVIGYVLVQLGIIAISAGGKILTEELSPILGKELTQTLEEIIHPKRINQLLKQSIRSRAR